jgi:hypothetical protein
VSTTTTTACAGHARPSKRSAASHTDPDIKAAWDDLRAGLTNMLRPHVAEISLDDLVKRAIAERPKAPKRKATADAA